MAKEVTEQSEIRRLTRVYKNLPAGKKAIAQGLIAEAARLRVLLDQLWADIEQNGMTEMFRQSEDQEAYERERPAARQYMTANKNYQTIIKQLDAMVPTDTPGQKGSKLGGLLKGLDE
ncbi:MAG: hypothetical protein IJ523_12640 [Succinivibrionaceae bacterium]|nr:hypothetical protein [Succinivibrionaceae bacterium]